MLPHAAATLVHRAELPTRYTKSSAFLACVNSLLLPLTDFIYLTAVLASLLLAVCERSVKSRLDSGFSISLTSYQENHNMISK